MKKDRLYMILSALPAVLFFIIAAVPVEWVGCRNRGLAAVAVAMCSGVAAVAAAMMGLRERIRGNAESARWMLGTFFLTVPVVALLLLA